MLDFKKAKLISIEGQDGSGKDTLVDGLTAHYLSLGYVVEVHSSYYNFEIGKFVKSQIVSDSVPPEMQMASVVLSRFADMVRILNKISSNVNVASDYSNVIIFANRYIDSTYAYQCCAKKNGLADPIKSLVLWSAELGIPIPHQTLYINCPTNTLKSRLESGYKRLDGHEQAGTDFFDSVGNGLVDSLREVYDGQRIIGVVDGTNNISTVLKESINNINAGLTNYI